jgi:Ca2+/H+ antiporter, TMEM165/GDT1 family
MESLFVSTGVVALAEIGDKTQLLAFILAARFKKPVPIVLGILAATLVNHGLAGALGAWITSVVSPDIMRWVLGLSFIGMAIWTLIPDKIEEDETTVALAAHYGQPLWVVAGTTLGMLIADVPAVFVGNRFAEKIPMKLVHGVAAAIFAVMGLLTLFKADKLLG